MDKPKIICYYLIMLIALILEIVFLFQIPYYHFSGYLQNLKIIRIIFGLLIFLVDVYFRVVSIAEILFDIKKIKAKKDQYFADKNIFNLIDKILIIGGFAISIINLILNIVGIVLSSKYLNEKKETKLQEEYYTRSLLLLFENILISICWIYFSIYWGFSGFNFLFKENIPEVEEKKKGQDQNEVDNNANIEAPPIIVERKEEVFSQKSEENEINS